MPTSVKNWLQLNTFNNLDWDTFLGDPAMISAKLKSEITTVETLPDVFLDTKDKTVTHSGMNESVTFDLNSTPTGDAVAEGVLALSGGAGQLDLTAIAATNGKLYDATGKKVVAVKFINASTANSMTVESGTSNGYDLLGAGWKVPLPKGGSATFQLENQPLTVGESAKVIKVTGTLTDALHYHIIFGH